MGRKVLIIDGSALGSALVARDATLPTDLVVTSVMEDFVYHGFILKCESKEWPDIPVGFAIERRIVE